MRAILLIALVMIYNGSWRSTDIRWYQGPTTVTANGEKFDVTGYTYASKSDPFGTELDVSWKGTIIRVRCNDRGPNEVELTRGAFNKLEDLKVGVLRGAQFRKIK